MERARERLTAGDPHGTVVIAEYQSAGRGRGAARSWAAKPGSSLLFTVLLRLETVSSRSEPPARFGLTPLVVGLGVAEAVESWTAEPVRLKWPNDLYLRDRKLAGVLCRYRDNAVLAGVGVNCNQRGFPPEIKGRAIALREMWGGPVARYKLFVDILARLQVHLKREERFGPAMLAAVNDRLYMRGCEVSFRAPDGKVVGGTVIEADSDGRLVLENGSGERRNYISGEILVGRRP